MADAATAVAAEAAAVVAAEPLAASTVRSLVADLYGLPDAINDANVGDDSILIEPTDDHNVIDTADFIGRMEGGGGGGGGGGGLRKRGDGVDEDGGSNHGGHTRGGERDGVDEILEEAVLSLPSELPFQQVDRIEYMNAQRESSTSRIAGSSSSRRRHCPRRLLSRGYAVRLRAPRGAHRRRRCRRRRLGMRPTRWPPTTRRLLQEAAAGAAVAADDSAFNLTLVTQTDATRRITSPSAHRAGADLSWQLLRCRRGSTSPPPPVATPSAHMCGCCRSRSTIRTRATRSTCCATWRYGRCVRPTSSSSM